MALKVSRKEFLGVDELSVPEPDVMAAKMALDFEAAVYLEMKKQGLRQKDLAEIMGVTAATVSKTLSETSNMTFKTAARIANALGCVLDAPTLHRFDADAYDSKAIASETASTGISIDFSKSDYKDAVRSEKMERSGALSALQSDESPTFSDSCEWGLAA